MKFVAIFLLATVAYAAPRDKRQIALGTISVSGAGGSTGCVVTGNVLYANGIKLRDLTAAEQTELDNYETELEQYKTQLREALNQRRENLRNQLMNQGQRGGRRGEFQQQQQQNDISGSSAASTGSQDGQDGLPKAPEKPSFCTAEQTTQYYFDGCMVQNNKVYVGNQFARDLTADEQSQLQTFDVQQTAYQNAVQAQVQSQMSGLFGRSDFLSALFGAQGPQQQAVGTTTPSTGTTTLPPKPVVPQFCTAIY